MLRAPRINGPTRGLSQSRSLPAGTAVGVVSLTSLASTSNHAEPASLIRVGSECVIMCPALLS